MSGLEELIKNHKAEAEEFAAELAKKKPAPKTAAAKKKAAGKKADPDKARAAVKKAMSVLEPEQDEETGEGTKSEPKAKTISKTRLQPITRPNGAEYTPRPLADSGKTDVETLQACREDDLQVLLSGYPGCGKTAMVEAAFGEDAITVEGHGDMEVADLLGSWQPNPDPNEPYVWRDGPLVRAMKEGRVLFLDDTTLVPAPVLARLYAAMDGRKVIRVTEHEGETVTAQPGFFVVGAHNPGAPGAILSEALSSRFLVQFEVESDLRIAAQMGVDRTVIRAARNLRKRREEGTSTWAPEMRELLGYARVAKTLGKKVAAANLVAVAPEESRDAVIEALGNSFPGVDALRLREDS